MAFISNFYNSGCVSPSLRLMAGFLALLLLAPAAPAEGGFRCDSVNRPVYKGKLRRGGLVSVARLSPGNHLFVTATHEVVRVYQLGEVLNGVADLTRARPVAVRRVAPGDNVEAGDFFPFGQCRFLLVSERRNTYRLRHV